MWPSSTGSWACREPLPRHTAGEWIRDAGSPSLTGQVSGDKRLAGDTVRAHVHDLAQDSLIAVAVWSGPYVVRKGEEEQKEACAPYDPPHPMVLHVPYPTGHTLLRLKNATPYQRMNQARNV